DPGTDTRSGYSIAWGDGSTDTFTPAQWAAASGSFTHTYADGAATPTITVSTTDEDGTTVLGTQAVAVANVAPSLVLDGAASTLEGATYQLTLTGSDVAGSADPLAYSIAWGDGSTQTVLAADLPASGIVSHVFTDDEDGPANATARQVTVTVTDGDGGSTEVSKTVTVNNVAPSASLSGPTTVDEGSVYTLTVGAILDPGTDTRSGYSIAWGDGSTDSFTPAQWAAAAGSFTHTYADGASTPTITVSTTDEDGSTVLGTQAVAVANVAPSLVLDGAASTLEGATYQLTLTGSDVAGSADPLAYSIAWGDGSTQTVLAADLPASGIVSHVFTDDEDGPANATARQVTVTVTDGDGGSTEVSKTVTVNNVAPTIEATGAASTTTGLAYTLSLANYLDPGQDTLLPDGILINWGDGSTSTASAVGDITHTYSAAGTPTILVSLADEDGSYANVASLGLTVGLPTPTLSLAVQAAGTVNEGSAFTRSIAFSDGEDSNGDGWSYNVQWNDGVVQSGTTTVQHFDLSRTAADGNATLTATITVSDTGGADSDTESLQLNVANVAPTASISGASAVDEGSVYTLTVGAITDPGTDTRSGYTIAWGDGSTDSFTPAQWAAAAGSFTHTYADGASTPTITVSTTDEDGTTVLGTQAVTVNDVAPSASLSGAGAVNEGSVYALGIGAILDPGADSVSEYRIVWGDETTPGSYQSVSAAQLALAGGVVTHTYADGAASYSVQVFAQNDDGLFALGTHAVDVLNVAPTVDASGAASATVGVAYTLSLANYLDPGQDTLLPNGIVVDWGDGTQSTASSLGDLTHTYLAASTPTLTVSLADEDGSYANVASLGLTVGLPTPTLSLAVQAAGTVNEGSAFTRSIAFSDGEDSNGDGWSYNVQWNDGVVQSGTTTVQHFDLNRTAADGAATLTATITVSDTGGADSDSTGLQLNVANVAPAASVSGPATVDEGSVYTLTVGAITDPGTDT
ncbi:hypothetical protein, partial [Zoogloea sp.]|uniref:beta strand repeat-containing protein n=1 Tax=Zoogloea sp. TaxID=49181 RepID=UPI002638C1BA